ncbi:uncharacterized protein N7500_007131 [Penicillium coprophilum]|uniref:uncharacterized protein n=1 Tax=Penicillium coprophilum TaxID=36646 RepID=UPI00239175E8|nr:uncharacterized protein N7500_007131 [Penicillium coprophilum]KAJ5165301.1 hypothetical protein N7500_007131 [Penicillium coprophilum]
MASISTGIGYFGKGVEFAIGIPGMEEVEEVEEMIEMGIEDWELMLGFGFRAKLMAAYDSL